MSCLTSGNNGCGCGNGILSGNGSCTWIILLLLFCGGCGNGVLGGNRENSCCDWIIWILLLSCICGGNGDNCGSCASSGCNTCC